MLADCPDPSEVTDFHFLQLRTLKIATKNKSVPEKSGNILATASKYGLLFTGIEGGFNVIKLETILTLDEDKENGNIVENYLYDFVASETPSILSVNSSETTLAVCVKCATNVVINLYSLSSYCGSGSVWKPFCTNALSPSGAEIRDFVWNPAIENWYIVCYSDGSMQIHEVAGMSIKIVGTLQGANAVTVCWSPKGKQLVAGKEDGSFTQYKPNLTEVKTVPPPGLEESSISVASICWIANTLFAVVYVVGDTPNLFIVSTPKDSAFVYTNFYDVCLGNNSAPHQRYLLHLEPSWGILVCASLDSIEIAVLGNMPNWVQWDLKEDGKALLPGKDGATHAVGMTVMYSAQRQLVISESESYPPMPILFLLTNNGLLVSFHMINSNPSAVSLVSAPLSLDSSMGKDMLSTEASLSHPKQAPNQSFLSSTFIKGNQPSGDQSPVQQKEFANTSVSQTFQKTESSSTPTIVLQKESSSLSGDVRKPETISFSHVQKSPAICHAGATDSFSLEKNEVQLSTQNSYMTAIIAEIQSFAKELNELQRLQCSAPTIEGEEDSISLKMYALNLHNFQKMILETMQSISSDIYSLKNVLLESFVLVEEAYSRERRRNDHSYITMLKERALDPITAKRMCKMNQHYQYLNMQMREVNDRLDQDWIHLCSEKGRRSLKGNLCISSTEAIYKTIVNNQKIIHNLRKKVEMLMKKSDERRLWNMTKSASWGRYQKRLMQEDLSKLADEFLEVKIAHPEENEPRITTRNMSSKSQMVLKEFLKRSNPVTVRPTAVYSPSQSRLLSSAAPSDDFLGSDHGPERDDSPKQMSTVAKESERISFSSETQTPKIASDLSFSFERTPNQSVSIAPIYEAISPPDAMNTSVSVNKSVSDGVLSSSMTSDKQIEPQIYHQPLSKSSMESSVKSSTDQDIGFSIVSNINRNNIEKPPHPVEAKPLTFCQTSSESVPISLFHPKTFSFAHSNQKSTDIGTPNPLTVGNSALVSSAATVFQYSGPSEKEVHSASPVNNSVASTAKISFQLESKKIPETSVANTLNIPVSSSPDYCFPMPKTSQTSSSSLSRQFENKNSTLFDMSGDKSHPDTLHEKSSTGFFFQKLSDNANQSVVSTVKTDVSVSSSLTDRPANETSVLNLTLSKSDSVDSKSPSSFQPEKCVTTHSPRTSPVTIQKTQSSVTSISQLTATNQLSNFSELKQLIPSPTSEPSSVTTGVTKAQTTDSTVTLPVSSESPQASSSSTISVVSQPDQAIPKSPTPPAPVTTTTSAFGQSVVVTSSVCSGAESSVTVSVAESSASPAFGVKAAPLFGQSSGEASSFFGAGSAFSQTPVTQASLFGQTASNSTFPSSSGGFFSQMPSFGSPAAATSTTSSSDFNNQTSTFSFGKSTFGQASGSFGLAKSFFGQNATPFTQAGSSSTSFSFSQNNNVFGQGSFFSGLGGKPNEENASKNVFGLASNIKSNSDTSNLFKISSVTSFGAVNSGPFSSNGSFSGGGGSVAQAGFGAFQQNTSPQTGSFGSAPSFGGAPSFGSMPAFGATPSFGSGNALTPSVFGQQQVSSNFSNFANASSPTFGSLASQSPGFGSPPPVGGFSSQGTGFGSPPVFGGSSFGSQPSTFGSPSSPPSNSSAFTQWRN